MCIRRTGRSGTTRTGTMIPTRTIGIPTRTTTRIIAATTTTFGGRGGDTAATLVFVRGRDDAIESHRLNGGHNGAFRTLTVIATGTGSLDGLTVTERLEDIDLDGLGRQRDTHRGNTGGQRGEHGTLHRGGAPAAHHGGGHFKVVTGWSRHCGESIISSSSRL